MAVILVVDDEQPIRKLLEILLQRAGHEVLLASNGLEAVALFRSYADHISVVVSDLTMPVMNGHQAIRSIREGRPNAKIICMTGYTNEDMPEGVVLISKPFKPAEILSSIESLLKQPS